jgi:hypothetical protein
MAVQANRHRLPRLIAADTRSYGAMPAQACEDQISADADEPADTNVAG